MKGQWVALEVKCDIIIFRSFRTLLGHRDTCAEGTREGHERCTYGHSRRHGIVHFDSIRKRLRHGHRRRRGTRGTREVPRGARLVHSWALQWKRYFSFCHTWDTVETLAPKVHKRCMCTKGAKRCMRGA